LPRRRNGSRIAGKNRDVERANVDAQLQRVGRDDRAHARFPKTALNLPPAIGQVAAAIPADDV
jgi:hypothetical protein